MQRVCVVGMRQFHPAIKDLGAQFAGPVDAYVAALVAVVFLGQ